MEDPSDQKTSSGKKNHETHHKTMDEIHHRMADKVHIATTHEIDQPSDKLHIKQIFRIMATVFGIWYAGYLVQCLLPMLPAVINGFVILFIVLVTRIVKEKTVVPMEKIFVPIITVFFVPSTVNIYFLWDQIKSQIPLFLLFIVVSCLLVFFFTYFISLLLIRIFKIHKKGS